MLSFFNMNRIILLFYNFNYLFISQNRQLALIIALVYIEFGNSTFTTIWATNTAFWKFCLTLITFHRWFGHDIPDFFIRSWLTICSVAGRLWLRAILEPEPDLANSVAYLPSDSPVNCNLG